MALHGLTGADTWPPTLLAGGRILRRSQHGTRVRVASFTGCNACSNQ